MLSSCGRLSIDQSQNAGNGQTKYIDASATSRPSAVQASVKVKHNLVVLIWDNAASGDGAKIYSAIS